MALNLSDPNLFGNDAGEDEDPDILASYFVEKPAFERFYDPFTRLGIVRARKGMGKSALLARAAYRQASRDPRALVISVRGPDLTGLGEFSSPDPAVLINQWQQVICARINIEIGKRLKFAGSDGAITMVESAELAGFKGRNIVGALVDRLRGKLGPVELQKLKQDNAHALLKSYVDGTATTPLWFLIDDIDATFLDTPLLRLKIATFFSACRKLASDISGLALRASVRTDVWTAILRTDESLDKCEQYILDLTWGNEEAKRILVKKVFSYVARTMPDSMLATAWRPETHADSILRLAFTDHLRWGDSRVPPEKPIYILSAGRPRWSAQLCRLAGVEAHRQRQHLITIGHVNAVMKPFGKYRLDDLYREHRHQFSHLQTLIEAFAGGGSRYTTRELQDVVVEKFLKRSVKAEGLPPLDGFPVSRPLDYCRFLFRIGFIFARDEASGLSFVKYEDRPDLLKNTVNLDDSLIWEIHPSYRQVLRINPGARRGRDGKGRPAAPDGDATN